MIVGIHQLDAYDEGLDSSDDEKAESVDYVENAQTLVINRGHPFVERLDPWPALNLRLLNGHHIR